MKDEPVINNTIMKLIAGWLLTLATSYVPALHVTMDQTTIVAMSIMSVVAMGWAFITRSKVIPVAKVEAVLKADHPAALAALKRPA